MDRPPGVPLEFDVQTVVFLVRRLVASDLPEAELERLPREHLAGMDPSVRAGRLRA